MAIADKIIEKCGGVANVALLCECTENWVYRWKLPVERGGTGGSIPAKAQEKLIAAAVAGRVRLKLADFADDAA